ncbi:helix-turn-helix domain-containing protein [Parabacteroides sp. Marseille-P3160]|uniref:helix-turn-helix domain-containing protein n=1 Tax=Parabacteroides sp. Marseille-P3160 TaxID=1917887 RepID=UPI0009B9442E|nr:helix-turn-helix domain-containing protein [Parabacteroides sp. Marseille-P3160]
MKRTINNLTVKEWFSEREAATYTGMSVKALQRLRYNGRVTFGVKRDGRSITYRKRDLDVLMEKNFRFYAASPIDANEGRFRT